MTRVGIAAGRTLRPNSSLAPSLGSFGLASGGSGFESTLPLSCAGAVVALRLAARVRRRTRTMGRRFMAAVYITLKLHGIRQSGSTLPLGVRRLLSEGKLTAGSVFKRKPAPHLMRGEDRFAVQENARQTKNLERVSI